MNLLSLPYHIFCILEMSSDCELAAENLLSRTELYLSQTGISDLSPLSGLTNLTKLTLRENQIAEIRPLAELTNLSMLILSSNQITDVSSLARLTNLFGLFLEGNAIPSDSSANAQPICPVSPPDVCKF
jgi:internalin A